MSSSTATLPLSAATPHLRAVRSLPASGDRWHGTAVPPRPVPQNPIPPHPATPHPATPHPTAQPGTAVTPGRPPQALLAALPEGAAIVAALPQGLPQALLAQYGVQYGGQPGALPGTLPGADPGQPMVGYLVLVPAETASAAPVAGPPQSPAPAPAAPAAARPVRPAGRGISVDVERRNAYVDGRLLDLTYLEFELLAHLTEHPQRVHTRDHLVSAVWGYGHVGDGRTVDVHVARLRRKLGSAYRESIVTVRRVGYKYTPVA